MIMALEARTVTLEALAEIAVLLAMFVNYFQIWISAGRPVPSKYFPAGVASSLVD